MARKTCNKAKRIKKCVNCEKRNRLVCEYITGKEEIEGNILEVENHLKESKSNTKERKRKPQTKRVSSKKKPKLFSPAQTVKVNIKKKL